MLDPRHMENALMPALSFVLMLAFMAGVIYSTLKLARLYAPAVFGHVSMGSDDQWRLKAGALQTVINTLSDGTIGRDAALFIDRQARALALTGLVVPLALASVQRDLSKGAYIVTADHLDEFKPQTRNRWRFALVVCVVGALASAYTLGGWFIGC